MTGVATTVCARKSAKVASEGRKRLRGRGVGRHTHLSRAANASPSADKAPLPEKIGLYVQPVIPAHFFRGVTCAVPALEIETEIERRLFEAGKMRKEMRHEIMERNRKLHVGVPD
jgi:hypothetical protein